MALPREKEDAHPAPTKSERFRQAFEKDVYSIAPDSATDVGSQVLPAQAARDFTKSLDIHPTQQGNDAPVHRDMPHLHRQTRKRYAVLGVAGPLPRALVPGGIGRGRDIDDFRVA